MWTTQPGPSLPACRQPPAGHLLGSRPRSRVHDLLWSSLKKMDLGRPPALEGGILESPVTGLVSERVRRPWMGRPRTPEVSRSGAPGEGQAGSPTAQSSGQGPTVQDQRLFSSELFWSCGKGRPKAPGPARKPCLPSGAQGLRPCRPSLYQAHAHQCSCQAQGQASVLAFKNTPSSHGHPQTCDSLQSLTWKKH